MQWSDHMPDENPPSDRYNEDKAMLEVIRAAESIAADLRGNADNRLRQTSGGGFIMVEEARVRLLLKAVDHLHSAMLFNT